MTSKLSNLDEVSFSSKAEASNDYSLIAESEKEPLLIDQNDSYEVLKDKPQDNNSNIDFKSLPGEQHKIYTDNIDELSFEEENQQDEGQNPVEHNSINNPLLACNSLAKIQVDDPSVSLILAPDENPFSKTNIAKNLVEMIGRHEKSVLRECLDELKKIKYLKNFKLGNQYFEQSELKKASFYFEKVIAQPIPDGFDIDMNDVFKKLASFFLKQREVEKSLTIIEKSWMPFLESSNQEVSSDLLMAKGRALRKLSKSQEALNEFQQAYDKKSQEYGADHPEVGFVLVELAKAERSMGKFSQAQGHLSTAISIFKRVANIPQSVLSAAYQELSTILVEQGKCAKAREILYGWVKAKNNNINTVDCAACYCRLGDLSFRMQDYSLSYQQYKQAKITLEALGKTNDCLMAKVEKGIGDVFNSRREHLKAVSQYTVALSIQMKFSKDSPDIASLLCTLADIKCKIRQFKESKQCLDKAYAIYENRFGRDNESLANVYHLYGNFFAAQEKNKEAFENYQKALTLSLKSHSAHYPELAPLYKRLGRVCTYMNEIDSAIQYYGKFLTIKDKDVRSSNSSEVAEVKIVQKALKARKGELYE